MRDCKDCKIEISGKWNALRCKDCAYEREKKKAIERQEIRRKSLSKSKNCKNCEKEFLSFTEKFCSRRCFFDEARTSRKGKGNPSYRNGTFCGKRVGARNTGAKQCKAYKEKKIEEHGFIRCEYCHNTNAIKYEVHHLVFRSEQPKHENLHNEKNLILLCVGCHNDFHKHKDKREPFLEEKGTKGLFPERFR